MRQTANTNETLWLLAFSPAIWAIHFLLSYGTVSVWCAKISGRDNPIDGALLAILVYTALALVGIVSVGLRGHRRHRLGNGNLPHDDDTALESGMVSKTIEGAQSRVEGYNFDARKHVVQYDDVINRQRETIYHERERILRSKDLSGTIQLMLEEEVRTLVADNTAGEQPSDWNREGLKARLTAMIPTLDGSVLDAVDQETDVNALTQALIDAVADAYERKRTETGEDGIRVLERLVLLRVIDSLWVEHLTAVDDMRRGIGLRAYSQRDPLNEFKIEAYRMFEDLKGMIRHEVAQNIFRVTVVQQPQPAASTRRMVEGRAPVAAPMAGDGNGAGNGARVAAAASGAGAAGATAAAGGAGGSAGGSAREPVRAGPKLGRNEPCWCGSGKKYKRCHGA